MPINQNLSDISTDFECLKISVIRKGSQLSKSSQKENNVNQTNVPQHDTSYVERKIDDSSTNNLKNNLNSTNNKLSSTNEITFSVKKILLENELQRKEDVRKAVERKKEEMENFERGLRKEMTIMRSVMALMREQKHAEEVARIQAEEEQLTRQSEIRRKHEQQLQAQRIRERRERLEREEAEYRRKLKERDEVMEKIQPCRTSFQTTWENINLLTMNCKDKNSAAIILAPYISKLQELGQQMETLNEKARSGEISKGDINIAEDIVRRTEEVLNHFKVEIERINTAYDVEIARRENERKQAELQLQSETIRVRHPNENVLETQCKGSEEINSVADGNIDRVTLPAGSSSDTKTSETGTTQEQDELYNYVDAESWQLFLRSQKVLEEYSANHKEFLQSESTRKFRFECQKAINIPVNAISGISREHLVDKYERVRNLLTGKSSLNVSLHPQGVTFCKYTLAKKIVNQGETLVSSKPEMAFSVAAVAVAIWNDYPDFGELLLAHFYTACPYLVPVLLPQLSTQSIKDNKPSDYSNLKKHSGLMRLYASIIITKQRQGITKTHPHGLENAWRWLAATLHIDPRPETAEICTTLIFDMLEVAGNALWTVYPTQFPKLLTALMTQYFPQIKMLNGVGGGPLARLEEFLRNCVTNNRIPRPPGELSPDFW